MSFGNPEITNPEYKEIKAEDVVERATQELVDESLRGSDSGQDFIEKRRPHLVEDVRKRMTELYAEYRKMFDRFSGDTSGDTEMDMVNHRAETLMNLFKQREMVDVSAGGDVLDGKFSGADIIKDAAVFYVFQSEGTDDIGSISAFDKKLKNAEALINLFKSKDKFSYDQFQKLLVSGDMANAMTELENFKERELGGGNEKVSG